MAATANKLTPERMAALAARYPRAFGRTPLQRLGLAAAWVAAIIALLVTLDYLNVSLARIINGMDRIGVIAGGMFPPSSGGAFPELFKALMESIGMAFLGTLIASILALGLGFLGARNIIPSWVFRFSIRRSFDFLRGVDSLVWALVYVRAVGLGPLAGVLAIATSDIGTLSKLYAEAIENAEKKQAEGVKASGGNRLQVIRFGVLPQVLPIMLSNALYMFESNTRSATILGIVGAGGIGFHLSDRIRAHRWDEVGFIIIMIVVAVFVIDLISRYLRSRLIHAGTQRERKGKGVAAASA
ncbi:phosphonate transport system permease protein [Natronocella acetinitrilica]|uniref:Phosphonate transport system permease protein n=1 Tax=Natronocella acetinitrilica TaxID=414046 RepID=A0AAE3G6I0_9GAMM|nr:phosphonate ABC transporter, permease protein PhnE [Natronocella acetinitrilica]MCP1676680.1 phosphonate transport system permease protein [Natronocella acetinitrilica]